MQSNLSPAIASSNKEAIYLYKPNTERMEKYCKGCEQSLPISDYQKCKTNNDGLQYFCRPCQLKRLRDYRVRTENAYWKHKQGQPYLVYKFTNPDGMVYVGSSSTSAKLRYQRHRASYVKRTDNIPELCNSFDKFGFDNHIYEVVSLHETELEAKQAETKLILKNMMLKIAINKNISSIRVGQYTMEGELVKEWDNITIAASSFGKTSSSIYAALRYYKTARTAYGYKWAALPFEDGSIYDMKTNTLIESE